MIPYITYREGEGYLVKYYILQKAFPHINCIISQVPTKKFVEAVPIASYNLYIVFEGTIRGNEIPSYTDIDKEIIATMEDMAQWFYLNRILTDIKKYKKWKI